MGIELTFEVYDFTFRINERLQVRVLSLLKIPIKGLGYGLAFWVRKS